jgi:hypothetical protein
MDRQQLVDRLRLLGAFYYASAILTLLCGSMPIIHVVIGIMVLVDPQSMGPNPPPPGFGWLFVAIGAFAIVLSYAFAAATALAGKWLREQRHRTFCIVMAAITCLSIPIGTILGVFTLLALTGPGGEQLFREGDEIASGAPGAA